MLLYVVSLSLHLLFYVYLLSQLVICLHYLIINHHFCIITIPSYVVTAFSYIHIMCHYHCIFCTTQFNSYLLQYHYLIIRFILITSSFSHQNQYLIVCHHYHTDIHTYINPYIHTYMHIYIQTYIHTYKHTCMHARILINIFIHKYFLTLVTPQTSLYVVHFLNIQHQRESG